MLDVRTELSAVCPQSEISFDMKSHSLCHGVVRYLRSPTCDLVPTCPLFVYRSIDTLFLNI